MVSRHRIELLRSPARLFHGQTEIALPRIPMPSTERSVVHVPNPVNPTPPATTAVAESAVAELVSEPLPESPTVSPDELNLLSDLLTGLSEHVQQLREQQRQSLEEMQTATVELAVSAASWLTGMALDAGLFAVDDMIRMAIHQLEADVPVQVHLNPEDHRLLQTLVEQESNSALWHQLDVVEQPALPRGSFRVQTGRRALVSDLDSRLEEIRRLWMENLDATQVERRSDVRNGRTIRRFPDRRETA